MVGSKPFVALCESKRQVDWLLDHSERTGRIDHLVAANPDAAWALQQRQATYLSIEDFDTGSLPGQIEASLSAQIGWTEWVDRFLQDSVPEFAASDFRPTRNYLFQISGAWDTFIHRARVLDRLFEEVRPGRLLYFGSPSSIPFNELLYHRASAFSALIPARTRQHGIPSTPFPPIRHDSWWSFQVDAPKPQGKVSLGSLLPRSLREWIRMRTLSREIYSRYPRACRKSKTPRLVLRKHYDLNRDVWDRLHARGIDLLWFDDLLVRARSRTVSTNRIRRGLKNAWHEVKTHDEFWGPPGMGGESLRDSLGPLFQHYWFRIVPTLWKCMKKAQRILAEEEPDAVGAAVGWPEDIAFLMAARANGLVTIGYQHGTDVSESGKLLRNACDLTYYDHLLVYSDDLASWIRRQPQFSATPAAPIPVGSARMDFIRRQASPESIHATRRLLVGDSPAPLILYVPSYFSNNHFSLACNRFQDLTLFEARRRIADLFRRYPKVHFAYKKVPASQGHDPTLDMITTVCPGTIVVRSDILLPDLQWAADGIIHEILSTGMTESMLTDRPLILYADRNGDPPSEQTKRMIRKRAILAETLDDFVRHVARMLEAHEYRPIVNPDQEYVERYATYRNDGKSADRAADAICGILAEHRRRTGKETTGLG